MVSDSVYHSVTAERIIREYHDDDNIFQPAVVHARLQAFRINDGTVEAHSFWQGIPFSLVTVLVRFNVIDIAGIDLSLQNAVLFLDIYVEPGSVPVCILSIVVLL